MIPFLKYRIFIEIESCDSPFFSHVCVDRDLVVFSSSIFVLHARRGLVQSTVSLYTPLSTLMTYRQQSFGYSTLFCIAPDLDSIFYCFTCDFMFLPICTILLHNLKLQRRVIDMKICKRILNYECTTHTDYAKCITTTLYEYDS